MLIEDYALLGDTRTAALVGRDGSVDWLCLPRFDAGSCFTALLGGPEHGRWELAPEADRVESTREYRPGTLVLVTEFRTEDGRVRVTDWMPLGGDGGSRLARRVEGVAGTVVMRSAPMLRFDYGSAAPWIRTEDGRLHAFTGPDAVTIDCGSGPPTDHSEQGDPLWQWRVDAGDVVDFCLSYHRSHDRAPAPLDVERSLRSTTNHWVEWTSRCTYDGPYQEAVTRSLLTLKALTYQPSGGIVAAPTTSLPEQLGGVRNWDYRYCWIRDATFTLLALLDSGYVDEAAAWREWLLRALAGAPEQMQIMYGIEGERRLPELELDWLRGYQGSRPVRIGNAAAAQFQLDVYGELMDALHQARRLGAPPREHAWQVQRTLLEFLESKWHEPDYSIWEMRGPARHYTYSKVMAWAAFDRGVKAVENFDLPGPVERWRAVRTAIAEEVCTRGYDRSRNTFTQYYGSDTVDAALLLLSEVGFLPPSDPRIRGTIDAIEKELFTDGFVQRYSTGKGDGVDGLPPGEGAFLACSFWLADAYAAQGRRDDAHRLFQRLLGLCNDVGLLAEEYDTDAGQLVGNFPQALSHIALVNTALNLAAGEDSPRSRGEHSPEGERSGGRAGS